MGLASGEGACSLESGVIQTMAMGSVVRLIMLPATMGAALHELRAVEVLLRVGQSEGAHPQLRLMYLPISPTRSSASCISPYPAACALSPRYLPYISRSSASCAHPNLTLALALNP